jgi:hypoxanthine-guanine phosphoribosyltransferase
VLRTSLIKAEASGQCHDKVRIAVGIDGQLRDVEVLVPDDTLDGGAGLANIIENQGLRVKNASAIVHAPMHMSVNVGTSQLMPRLTLDIDACAR